MHHLDPVSTFYHDLPPADAEEWKKQIKHHSRETLASRLTYPAYKYIPTTYLLCKDDQAIPYERQLKLVEDAGVPITTVTCDASHSPFLSQPALTVKVIRNAAGEKME